MEAILDCGASFDPATATWSGSLRDRLLFALLVESGLRLGEALRLRHRDWHTGGGRAAFVEVVPGEHPHRVRVKGSQYRKVFVSGELDRLYGEYLWQVADQAASVGREVDDDWYVFVSLAREPLFAPMRPKGVYQAAGRIHRRLGDQLTQREPSRDDPADPPRERLPQEHRHRRSDCPRRDGGSHVGYESFLMPDEIWDRALEVQSALCELGQLRAVKFPDLLIAATAERHGLPHTARQELARIPSSS